MAKYFLLFQLQIKSAFKSLPKIILGTAVFSALVILIGIAGNYILTNQGEARKPMNVAMVLPPDGDKYTNLAFSFLSEIDTVKNICSFEKMSQNEAISSLRSGTVSAIVLLPDNFVSHILNGTNTPANIILPTGTLNTQSALFRAFINAGASDLSSAQAGIYAVDDVARNFNIPNGVSKAEDYLNREYFSYALDRNVYFDKQPVYVTGDLNIIEFYICSGLVLLLLFSGISSIELLKREPKVLTTSFKRRGIKPAMLFISKGFSCSLVYFLLIALAWGFSFIVSIRITSLAQYIPVINIAALFSLFIIIFSIFAFIIFIFSVAKDIHIGALLLFLFSVVFLFISGGFIPKALLPDVFEKLAGFLPTTYYIKALGEIITQTVSWQTIGINIMFAAIFIGFTALLDKVRNED